MNDRRSALAAQIAQNKARIEAQKAKEAEQEAWAEAARTRFIAEVAALKLWPAEGTSAGVAAPYLELCRHLYETRHSGRSRAVLAWPTGNLSLAAAHALCCLALARSSEVQTAPYRKREPAEPLRALFYPYSSRARLPLRRVFVDRDQVASVSIDHIADEGRRTGASYAYFSRLCRARDLTGAVRGGGHHFEYEHPALDEVVSTAGIAQDDDRDVLWRIATRTDLRQLSNAPGDPAESPYRVVALRAKGRLRPGHARGKPLDIILLDLTRTARGRLASEWCAQCEATLKAVRELYGSVPVLALTDDLYVQHVLAFELLKAHDGVAGKRPVQMDAILGLTPAIAAEPAEAPVLSTVGEFEALGCADPDPDLLSDIARARDQARTSGDGAAAELLDDLAGVIRRTAALPGGVDNFGQFLAENEGLQAAAERMSGYGLDRLARAAADLAGPFAQQQRAKLEQLLQRSSAWVAARQSGSPLAAMLRELVKTGLNGATRKVIWSQTAAVSEFAEHMLTADAELGARIRARVDNNMITFMDALAFREIGSLPKLELAKTKKVLVVSPRRSQALALMAQPWLPENVTLVADERTLAGVARDAGRLSEFPALAPYAERLKGLAKAALAEARRVRGRALQPDFGQLLEDVDFPEGGVIDLAGRRAPGEQIVRIQMEDRRVLLARPRTRLIAFDPDGAVPTYRTVEAREVSEGDRLCVIDQAFVDMARARLDIRATAEAEIRDYHLLVQRRFADLPGETVTARVREMIGRMGEPQVHEGTARTWVTLAQEAEKPLDLVVPRAPQDWATFERFMTALGVPRDRAANYWAWAVILTRRNRVRAAARLHEAYVSILVDAFTAEHLNPARAADIRALRAAAEGYVSAVAAKTLQSGNDA